MWSFRQWPGLSFPQKLIPEQSKRMSINGIFNPPNRRLVNPHGENSQNHEFRASLAIRSKGIMGISQSLISAGASAHKIKSTGQNRGGFGRSAS
jgi:hypothetical protein